MPDHFLRIRDKLFEIKNTLFVDPAIPSFEFSVLDPSRENILLVCHDASRTGAPVVGCNIAAGLKQKYNVITLILGEADALLPDFRQQSAVVLGPFHRRDRRHPQKMERIVQAIVDSCRLRYAIVNSSECRAILKFLNNAKIPTVTLVHELSRDVRPIGSLGRSLAWSDQIIFSADLVAKAACKDWPPLAEREIQILPQGRNMLSKKKLSSMEEENIEKSIRPNEFKDAVIVMGCGSVTPRKGVDIFIACADEVRRHTKRKVRFVWVGGSSENKFQQQMMRELKQRDLKDMVVFVDPILNLDIAYKLADIFFLSSRGDPMPNVCIEAAVAGLPVVCFKEATGFAEVLERDPVAKKSLVQKIGSDLSAEVILEIIENDELRKAIGNSTRKIAERVFDMAQYVENIDRLAAAAADRRTGA